MLAVQVLVSFAGLVGPVVAPLAALDLGAEPHWVGLFVGLIYGMAAIAALLSGGFIARYGALRVSQASLVLAAAAMACGAIGTAPSVLAAGLLMGMAYGPATPASSHILAQVTPPGRMNLVFSLKQTGVPLGNMLAGALLPGVALALGWRGAVIVAGAACFALAVLVQPLRRRFDHGLDGQRPLLTRQQAIGPLRIAFASKDIRRLAITSFVYSGMQVSLSTFLVTYLHKALDMPLVLAGFVLSAAQLGGVSGRVLWGIVADRFARPAHVLGGLGLGMTVAALLTASFTPSWPLAAIVAVAFAYGATAVAWNGVYLAQIARLSPPGKAGEVTGGTSLLTFGGVMVAPTVFSAILSATGSYALGFTILAVLTCASGLAYFTAAPHRAGGT